VAGPEPVQGVAAAAEFPAGRGAGSRWIRRIFLPPGCEPDGHPSAIHEQNSVPGVTNRILAKRVDRVLVSFKDMESPLFSGQNAVVTGNPVRAEIRRLRDERRAPGRNILIVGGSQGASALNRFVLRELDSLKQLGFGIWHQTGKDEFESVRRPMPKNFPRPAWRRL
jgi:UDP-N-acetylglucosamine--N-acetylmuramyl-(pentapeptide) pyrophosphoryl-undecaprenol N-acetylglucosamine transferase (EC 2.4.1.227)